MPANTTKTSTTQGRKAVQTPQKVTVVLDPKQAPQKRGFLSTIWFIVSLPFRMCWKGVVKISNLFSSKKTKADAVKGLKDEVDAQKITTPMQSAVVQQQNIAPYGQPNLISVQGNDLNGVSENNIQEMEHRDIIQANTHDIQLGEQTMISSNNSMFFGTSNNQQTTLPTGMQVHQLDSSNSSSKIEEDNDNVVKYQDACNTDAKRQDVYGTVSFQHMIYNPNQSYAEAKQNNDHQQINENADEDHQQDNSSPTHAEIHTKREESQGFFASLKFW
jgi:hypothetical protein